ncbi:MAG: adenosylcobalamin-dependent ribonucleoside-diphosphate reductase [Planctomycetota bacterium]|nr:adenosylcobalamin-dependent ribonucleoside-diphosphate reductase [Planctomycetota bacterium]
MKVTRRFTTAGKDVYSSVEWTRRSSKISNADGSTVFEMRDAEIPKEWSQLATDIVVSKYFRKAGVPQLTEEGTPLVKDGQFVFGPERSVRQVVHRLAGCWRHWGEKHGYFETTEDAEAFYDEIAFMMLRQMAAPNSPQWFNTGLHWAYGINGPAQGHWISDPTTGQPRLADDAYTHPQPHACFIQSISDDLVKEGGIMDLWTREARLFKYGSGTGTNFSNLRGENEPLSGGGKSSGLMSFLKIGDRAAAAIKSGGTTRRAAKMVCLDVDHPDIETFVNWKVREEIKVAALVEGMKHIAPEHRELAAKLNLSLDYDFNGEAYMTVSGQNSNNSIRISDEFMESVERNDSWTLTRRTDGTVHKTIRATDLWEQVNFAAWRCADPGVQFDSTINAWHTCPQGGRINASNPCSEYMFLDNTACNLASLNLITFYNSETRTFDIPGYEHAIRLWTVVLEISVLMAAFPSREIAELSWKYRTLGLGFANLGAMLMQAGIPYDSDEARAVCATVSALLTGRSYATSAELAGQLGAFAGYNANRDSMLRVMRNHRRAAKGLNRISPEWESLRIRPVPIDHALFAGGKINIANATGLLEAAVRSWDETVSLGERHGFRNAQTTVIAPTGTIGLLMDCDTTGVEPDFALTKYKKLAGGGYFKIANQSVRPALKALGYPQQQSDAILAYVMGTMSLDARVPAADGLSEAGAPTLREWLVGKGYTNEELVAIENTLPGVPEVSFSFSSWSMPERIILAQGLSPEAARADKKFDGLRALGLTRAQIDTLNRTICGTLTVEGAPGLKGEHLPVFDCANRCGCLGQRFIRPEGHILMMAASQPFISGAISKTINLPNEAVVADIGACYRMSWELGLKANALYRDGCKLSQPLNSGADKATEDSKVEREAEDTEGLAPMVIPEPQIIERIVERIVEKPMRRRLPDTRSSLTHKFNVAGHEGYLIVGLYEDGRPGELFITMAKEGSTIGGLMDSLGTAISVALQYGVPVESLVKKFAHQRFEPMGMTTNNDIPFAKSLVDYIFRWLGMEFIEGYRDENAPPRATPAKVPSSNAPAMHTPAAGPAGTVTEDTTCKDRMGTTIVEPATGRTTPATSNSPTSNGAATSPSRATSSGTPSAGGPALWAVARAGAVAGGAGAHRASVTSPAASSARVPRSALDAANQGMMGDAPACDACGSITIRNGTCYKCVNCGQSMGCS